MAKWCDLQSINDLFHLFACLFFRYAEIQDTKRNFLIDTGREKLVIGILKYNADFASKFQKLFFGIRVFFSVKKSFPD